MTKFTAFQRGRIAAVANHASAPTDIGLSTTGEAWHIETSTHAMLPPYEVVPVERERVPLRPEDDEDSHELLGVLIMLAVAAAWAIVWL